MILIADSGSTKTKWVLLKKGNKVQSVLTDGINPFFRTVENIAEELEHLLMPNIIEVVSEVHFYGAGIINDKKGSEIGQLLQKLFPEAIIETQSDLLAAARATCGKNQGIACILGTGSNSCLYNGEKIIEHVSPLGFILGDEASGAVMGRKLIGDYFKNAMPENLRNKFKTQYNINWQEILESVYKKPRPNTFLASFTTFLYENIKTDYCVSFVKDEFHAFIKRNILNYTGYENEEIHFIGSIAYFFQSELKNVLAQNNLVCGKIIQDPIKGLITFHSK
jgi:N-acetylglucosamine kinase-like BadF-type ATPase